MLLKKTSTEVVEISVTNNCTLLKTTLTWTITQGRRITAYKIVGFLVLFVVLNCLILNAFSFDFNAVFVSGADDFYFGDRVWNHGLCPKRQGDDKP